MEVKATGDKVVVSYTMPIPSAELADSGMTVPPSVQYGGPYSTIDRTRIFELAFSV